jgi:hypothetical protein
MPGLWSACTSAMTAGDKSGDGACERLMRIKSGAGAGACESLMRIKVQCTSKTNTQDGAGVCMQCGTCAV